MTTMLVNYWNYREQARHNKAYEKETTRHNRASERLQSEQIALGYAQLGETGRHNLVLEQRVPYQNAYDQARSIAQVGTAASAIGSSLGFFGSGTPKGTVAGTSLASPIAAGTAGAIALSALTPSRSTPALPSASELLLEPGKYNPDIVEARTTELAPQTPLSNGGLSEGLVAAHYASKIPSIFAGSAASWLDIPLTVMITPSWMQPYAVYNGTSAKQ